MMLRRAALLLVLASTAARADVVVFDFGTDPAPRAEEVTDKLAAALVTRFPHPTAGGKVCDPNYPNTPANERAGGQLLPRITTAHAAVTRPGAAQDVFLIDYCPTGNGQPRTRRLLVLDGDAVALDRQLDAQIPADEVLGAVDIDRDGRAELVLTTSVSRGAGVVVNAQLVRTTKAKLQVLGAWTGIEHCSIDVDDAVTHAVTYRPGTTPKFKDVVSKHHCFYPPAPR